MKRLASLLLASIFGGALALGGYIYLTKEKNDLINVDNKEEAQVVHTNYTMPNGAYAAEETDFTDAAQKTVNVVVHVKNVSISNPNPLYEFFYGSGEGGGRATIGTGSGVIVSPDGYIVTNNHVIRGARDLEITLNNKQTYEAKVVGADERTDIALLKIEASNLPYITFANSDNVRIGEWVLAVGNPFNLTSTVTAGIVSAKARNLNISRDSGKLESFIQTDAAVNPGNSGGALVNSRGELVGINTAITSQTGSYVGYSFAVPSNIAKKVVEDIMEFGDVQTAYLGISTAEINGDVAKQLDINTTEGVLVASIRDYGAAKTAGIKENDIIINVDNHKIAKFSDLQGFLGTKRPGDEVTVTVLRGDDEKDIKVKLGNQFGKESIGKLDFSKYLIGDLKKISSKDADKYRINYGVEITNIRNSALTKNNINKGDIILKIENEKVYSVDDVEEALRSNKGNSIVVQLLNSEGYAEYIKMFIPN